MSIGHVNRDLDTRLPLDRIAEICQRYGVSELSVYGPKSEGDTQPEGEILFLVSFRDDDAGPWGSKLDELENDLSGALHRPAPVATRQGIEQSSPPGRRDLLLGSAQRIYES
jgi:predicted nucleotidyltransferase